MKTNRLHSIKNGVIALAMTLFFSCKNNFQEVQQIGVSKNEPMGVAENINLKYTDSGRVTANLLSPKMFDFSNPEFFNNISEFGERYSKSTELRSMNGSRGSKHFIYINRTFFGLYNLMFDLKAKNIKINNFINL